MIAVAKILPTEKNVTPKKKSKAIRTEKKAELIKLILSSLSMGPRSTTTTTRNLLKNAKRSMELMELRHRLLLLFPGTR